MNSEVYRLAYVSQANQKFSDDDIISLLLKSRENNEKRDVTGILVANKGHFFQILEGPKEQVQDLYSIIQSDKRHSDVLNLYFEEKAERLFQKWYMAYKKMDEFSFEAKKKIDGYLADIKQLDSETLKDFVNFLRKEL